MADNNHRIRISIILVINAVDLVLDFDLLFNLQLIIALGLFNRFLAGFGWRALLAAVLVIHAKKYGNDHNRQN